MNKPHNVDRTQTNNNKNDAGSVKSDHLTLMILLSIALLGVTVALVILFASGLLRFGLEGPFVFIIYIIAGLLVAVLCFGALQATAEATGNVYGLAFKLGGPVVALVLVAGGGSLYELYVKKPTTFDVRVFFYEDDKRMNASVKGELTLVFGDSVHTEKILPNGSALFQKLPSKFEQQATAFQFSSQEYIIHPEYTQDTLLLSNEAPLYLRVKRKPLYAEQDMADVNIKFEGSTVDKMITGEYILNISILATNKSERPVPISPVAKMYISDEGLKLKTVEMDASSGLYDPVIILKPQISQRITMDVKLEESVLSYLDHGHEGQIAIYYNQDNLAERKEFYSDFFSFSKIHLGWQDVEGTL